MTHMGEVFKVITINRINFDKINFYYTTDLEQNNDSLSSSLYSFVNEDGKFKIRKNEAKILL